MDKTVTEYIEDAPEIRKGMLELLQVCILECFPRATVDMKYKMPTYTFGEGWVAIANQKEYVSLYTCGPQHIEAFNQKFPDYKTGKGCINFKENEPIPFKAVKAVIRHAILHPKGE